MNASTQFLARLGMQYPIIQAPMAGVSTPHMAAAVSNAGGLGSLGIGASTAAQARQMIVDTRALTTKPFNVNVFCHTPARRDAEREAAWVRFLAPLFAEAGVQPPAELQEIYQPFGADDAVIDMLLDLRPAVVSFHFRVPPAHIIHALHGAGILTLGTATSPHEAALLEEAGVHAIVAQGIEAGGHRGTFDPDGPDERLSTSVLLRLLARQTRLPIIAAGGIMDGADIAHALSMGAQAVQMGTAFLVCDESGIQPHYKERLMTAGNHPTRLTRAFSGRYARGLENRFMRELALVESELPAYPIQNALTGAIRAEANKRADTELMSLWCGTGVNRARAMPAAQLVQTLMAELKNAQ